MRIHPGFSEAFLKSTVLSVIVLFMLPGTSAGQLHLPPADGLEYYYRVLQVSGITDDRSSFSLRPVTPGGTISASHPWQEQMDLMAERNNYMPNAAGELYLYEPVLFQSFNSTLPRGTNDGAVWQGKGYNAAISGGVQAVMGPVQVHFRPQAGFAQNREFDLGPYLPPTIRVRSQGFVGPATEYAYRDFRGGIDYVQRYGDSSYSWFDLGQSTVEVRSFGLRAALSNSQIWTGPSLHTALHYGYSAPGFTHVSLGTYRPLSTPLGAFEFAYIFGGMRKSDYFDLDQELHRLQSANTLIAIYSPRFLPGLSVGAIRSFFHPYPDSFSGYTDQARKLFESAVRVGLQDEESPTGYDPDNQIASGFLRWVHPEAGLEIYGEYGRNDHNVDLRDFRLQPNHHRAYTIGMLKTFLLPENRLLAVGMEINQLEAMRTTLTRGNNHLGGWYTHGQQVMGITHRGQIPGTGYGPGANIQMLQADLFDEMGSLSFTIARIAYHNSRLDQFFHEIREANTVEVERHDVRNVELLLGVGMTAFLNQYGLELSARIDQSFIFNQHHIKDNDMANTRLELVLRKQIRGGVR
jgi:hypothetical protein